MPTYNISVLKHQQRKDKKFPVSIRITNNRQSAYIKTSYYVSPSQINKNFEIKDKFMLKMFLEKIEEFEESVARHFGNNVITATAKEIAEFLQAKPEESGKIDFITFAREHIQKLKEAGRTKRANHIQTTINALVDFLGNKLEASALTSKLLVKFEEFLRSERDIVRTDQFGKEVKTHRMPLTDTGVHDYMADMRAVFNEMIDRYNDEERDIIAITNYPFRRYKLSRTNAPVKKNLDVGIIRKIMNFPMQNVPKSVFSY